VVAGFQHNQLEQFEHPGGEPIVAPSADRGGRAALVSDIAKAVSTPPSSASTSRSSRATGQVEGFTIVCSWNALVFLP
jgi:hypothetical protein